MDYGGIVRRAIHIAWRHRWLWLVALLAGESSTGSSFNYRFPTSSQGSGTATGTPGSLAPVRDWVVANAALLVAGAAVLVVVAVILFVISVVAEGAAVRGVGELDDERPCGLGRAWGLGRLVFWPMLRLRLLVVVATIAVAVVALALLGAAILAFVGHQVGLGVLLGWQWAGFLVLLFPVALVAPTLLKLAARAIALDGASAIGSLGTAWRLLRSRLGPVAILWVIELACTIGVSLAFLIVVLALGLPAVVGGYYAIAARAYTTLALVGVYGLVLLAVLVIAGAAVAAFFSAYWTIGYRRLAGPG